MNFLEELQQMDVCKLYRLMNEFEKVSTKEILKNAEIQELSNTYFDGNIAMLSVIEKQVYREIAMRHHSTLNAIDTHIRATPQPIPYIINDLKAALPQYNE